MNLWFVVIIWVMSVVVADQVRDEVDQQACAQVHHDNVRSFYMEFSVETNF